ncbi:MAG: TIGR03986 family type III CRISPR-associated RAMP protein [Desulfurispora sp.]|uniref:TIGR03986 family type III CRISPR-associated RAMP protein n=1 Tax=Desulfurispora sp. TaxID=3014275 RepID=UPI00404B136B
MVDKNISSSQSNQKATNIPTKRARAPYNFVSLPEQVVAADPPPDQSKYHANRFTGCINLEIKVLTPLYIRDTYSIEEAEQKATQADHPDFFSPGGALRIPGSSLRGMVRTLMEVVSYARLTFYQPELKFYYRAVGEQVKSYRQYYINQLKQVKCGYLQYDSGTCRYMLTPANCHSDRQYYRVSKKCIKTFLEKNTVEFIELSQNPQYKISKKLLYFKASGEQVNELSLDQTIKTTGAGYLVLSGEVPGKKNQWLVSCPDTKGQSITNLNKAIENYQRDTWRHKNIDLLKILVSKNHQLAKDLPDGIPCFYLEDDGVVSHLGHTRWFRIPYQKSIGECCKQNLPADNRDDLVTVLFGKPGHFATRLFFEDAFLKPEQAPMDTCCTQILSMPKPTAFQHYLKQTLKSLDPVKHWDSDCTQIRGYKFYWHRQTPDDPNKPHSWRTKCPAPNRHQKGKLLPAHIRPIKKGCFQGKIRFENLSAVELGALLFVLDLPPQMRHKLGMGKPLGLGSVQIVPQLVLSEHTGEKGRYTQLLTQSQDGSINWYLPTVNNNNYDHQYFKAAFANWLLSLLKDKPLHEPEMHQGVREASSPPEKQKPDQSTSLDPVNKLWQLPRIKELAMLLHWTGTASPQWLEETSYMEVDEFKNRPVLPEPLAYSCLIPKTLEPDPQTGR